MKFIYTVTAVNVREETKMLISKKMETIINNQINAELYSAYIYLAMSAYFEAQNLKGFAHWMKKQAQEEEGHAMRFYKYIFDRGGEVVLKTIDKPVSNWESPLDVFEAAYEHEKKVTGLIYNIDKAAKAEDDKATESMLKWFIDEQIEEEDQAFQIVQQLKKIKGHPGALLMLDHRLVKRE